MTTFNGLNMHLGNLSLLSNAQTRSISAENFTGEKGKGGMATEGTGCVTRMNKRYNVARIAALSRASPVNCKLVAA